MQFFKLFFAVCTILFLFVACVTTGSGNIDTKSPAYVQGKDLGEQMAHAHRNTIVCSSQSRFQAIQEAKKQTNLQRRQGKSEDFCAGFYRGYKDVYEFNVGERCLD